MTCSHTNGAGGQLQRGEPRHAAGADLNRAAGAVVLVASLILGAGLAGLALSPPGYSWLAWFSLLPLFLAIRLLAPRTALLAGALWGLCFALVSAAVGVSACSPTLLSLTLFAAMPATYAFLGAVLVRRIGFSPLILGLGWVGVELAFHPFGLHQGLLAAAQTDAALIHWLGRLLGYVLVAFLLAYANALLLSIADEVRLKISQPRYIPRLDDYRGWLVPQTSLCIPLLADRPAHPRAPPASL